MKNEITTKTGFKFEIDEETIEDMRLFELIKKHDKGSKLDQIEAASEILLLFMGKKKEDYYDFLIEKEGRPIIKTIEQDISGIVAELSSPKKK